MNEDMTKTSGIMITTKSVFEQTKQTVTFKKAERGKEGNFSGEAVTFSVPSDPQVLRVCIDGLKRKTTFVSINQDRVHLYMFRDSL